MNGGLAENWRAADLFFHPGPTSHQQDREAYEKLKKEGDNLEAKLKTEFNNTAEGKQLFSDKVKAAKAAAEAHKAEQEAGKNIDEITKDKALMEPKGSTTGNETSTGDKPKFHSIVSDLFPKDEQQPKPGTVKP